MRRVIAFHDNDDNDNDNPRPERKPRVTLAMLAESFEVLGGVPAVVLTDRMGCLKGGVVANVVVPTRTTSGSPRPATRSRPA